MMFIKSVNCIQCESENFTGLPPKVFKLNFSKTDNFEAIFYTHIRRSNLCCKVLFNYS